MGFGTAEVEFVIAARHLGVDFTRTMTLGRQQFTGRRAALERLVGAGVWGDGYVEPFLTHLGARSVRSLDASSYQSATDVHDLNDPAPTTLHEGFSAVVDSGTLEHVFNLPEALRSAMHLVEAGGHLILMSPCNNNPGHGFYQLTPELLFRALAPENGYEVTRCCLREQRGGWYEVADPAVVGRRCEFRTRRMAYLFVVARRTSVTPIFATWPQQSDYTTEWSGSAGSGAGAGRRSRSGRMVSALPWKRVAMKVRSLNYPPSYRRRRDHFTSSSLRTTEE